MGHWLEIWFRTGRERERERSHSVWVLAGGQVERSELFEGRLAEGGERASECGGMCDRRRWRWALAQVIVWLPGDEGFYAINSVLSLRRASQLFNKTALLISQLILSRSTSTGRPQQVQLGNGREGRRNRQRERERDGEKMTIVLQLVRCLIEACGFSHEAGLTGGNDNFTVENVMDNVVVHVTNLSCDYLVKNSKVLQVILIYWWKNLDIISSIYTCFFIKKVFGLYNIIIYLNII